MFQKLLLLHTTKNIAKRLLSITALIILLTQFAHAQNATGKITGKITDGSTNETIAAVNIVVKGTKYGKASLSDGSYSFTLPVGTYTIIYSHAGYSTKQITGVVIKAGEPLFLEIILEAGKNKLSEVVIVSNIKKEAQSSLYSAQKRSAAASDGISQEAIRRTPDNNAGQILKRVVGLNIQDNRFVVVRGLNDQYNQTMLNGVPMTSTETNRNAFSFDLIPAAVIDNITVNKTATPDMPGNFAGGIVQVNTKDFVTKDFVSITLQTGFSDQTYGKDFYADKRSNIALLGFAEKSLDLPKDFPTTVSRSPIYYLSSQERSRYLRKLNNNLVPINYGPSKLNEAFQIGFGKTIKLKNEKQFGIIAAISQRKTELIENETIVKDPNFTNGLLPDTLKGLSYNSNSIRYRYSVDFGGVINLAYRFGNNKITLKNLYSQILNNFFIDRNDVGFFDDPAFNVPNKKIGITYFIEQKSIFNSTLAGEHKIGKNSETKLDWNVSATYNKTNTPDTRNFLFILEDSLKKIYGSPGDASFSTSLITRSRVWTLSKDFIYGGAFNITTPITIGSTKHLFKTGILFQNRQRNVTGITLPFKDIQRKTLDSIFAPQNYVPGGLDIELRSVLTVSSTANYKAGTNLLAAYESIESKIGKKLRIIWGLRLENYQQTVAVFTPEYLRDFQQPSEAATQIGARNTINILPSVNIIYSPVPSINIRGAYSNTVIRPELKDIADFERYDYQTFTLTKGNKFLKSASITNYDCKFEWFPSAGEIISFAAFYKKLIDPIEYSRGANSGSFNFSNFRIPVNAGDATVKGIELEIRKKIDFLPFAKWLSHVSFFGNGTLLKSKVDRKEINNRYFTYLGEHTLTGQANYIINAGLSINLLKNTFEATFSFNKTGDYINELGSSDFNRHLANGALGVEIPHYTVKARNLVDVVITQALWKDKCRIKFNISNLLNQPFILYQDINNNGKFDAPITVESEKIVLNNYLSGIDATPSIVQPQRTYSLAVTYTF